MNKKESESMIQMFRTLGFKCESASEAKEILFSFAGPKPAISPAEVSRSVDALVKSVFEEARQMANSAPKTAANRLGVCAECEDCHLSVFSWNVKVINDSGSPATISLPTKLCKKCGTFYAPFKQFDNFLSTLLLAAGGQKLISKDPQ